MSMMLPAYSRGVDLSNDVVERLKGGIDDIGVYASECGGYGG